MPRSHSKPEICLESGARSRAVTARILATLSPRFCRGRCAPFVFLCLLGFPGANHLRVARLVHDNLRRAPVYSRRGAAPRVRPLKTTERYFGCKQRIRGLSGANDFANRSARLGDLAELDRCRKGCRRAHKVLSCERWVIRAPGKKRPNSYGDLPKAGLLLFAAGTSPSSYRVSSPLAWSAKRSSAAFRMYRRLQSVNGFWEVGRQ